jgi:hypothetical protein
MGYDPDEARDDHGEWTDGGGGSSDFSTEEQISPEPDINYYVSDKGLVLNDELRKNPDSISPQEKEVVKNLDNKINQQGKTFTGKLYRGLDDKYVSALYKSVGTNDPTQLAGVTIKDPGYISTSESKLTASEFSRSGGAIIEITSSSKSFNVSEHVSKDFSGEREHLFPRGSTMKIQSAERVVDSSGRAMMMIRATI